MARNAISEWQITMCEEDTVAGQSVRETKPRMCLLVGCCQQLYVHLH